jgi:hypothetical protein
MRATKKECRNNNQSRQAQQQAVTSTSHVNHALPSRRVAPKHTRYNWRLLWDTCNSWMFAWRACMPDCGDSRVVRGVLPLLWQSLVAALFGLASCVPIGDCMVLTGELDLLAPVSRHDMTASYLLHDTNASYILAPRASSSSSCHSAHLPLQLRLPKR